MHVRRGRGTVLVTVAGLALVAACTGGAADGGTGAEPGAQRSVAPDDDRPPELPRRTGPRVVESGGVGTDAWQVHAQPSELGLCVEILAPERGRELGCDFEVPAVRDIGQLAFADARNSASFRVVAGPVVDYASTVRLEFARGAAVEVAPVEPMPRSEVDFYAADVSGRGPVETVVAVDRAGRTIGRLAPDTP